MNESLPTPCDRCPTLLLLQQQYDDQTMLQDKMITAAVQDMPLSMTPEQLAAVGLTPEEIVDVMPEVRAVLGRSADGLGQQAASIEVAMEAHRQGCRGVLGMRAVRESIEYTAYVCTSPRNLIGETSLEAARVQRRPRP